ncbi:MAG: hypothetical protein MAG453_00259 [Calditrichaeota bacterium]|nr:hypothetical protein [Calditrichota bacterium]
MEDDGPQRDQYLTISRPASARLKEKGSVFHAYAFPVADAGAADEQLAAIRKQHFDATHVGWARRLPPPPGGEERWSDDGEPSGSTGPPVLNAIRGRELWGALVAVARCFGGTKLGVGGLIRAYGAAADRALDAAAFTTVTLTETLRVEVPHDRSGAVYALADRLALRTGSPGYTETGLLIPLVVPRSQVDAVIEAVREATAARAKVGR